MSRSTENARFDCAACGGRVEPLDNGSYRNHCPRCLYSLHVDVKPGDRLSECLGLMRPAEIFYHSAKGFQIVHVCECCGHQQRNKVARNCRQPDDEDLIREIQTKNVPWVAR